MLVDFAKLFKKETQIGRFEYIKIWGALGLYPIICFILLVAIPPESKLVFPMFVITVIINVLYLVVFLITTYKRVYNIFQKTSASIISIIIYVISIIFKPLNVLFDLLLIFIKGKIDSDNLVSKKFFWISLFLSLFLVLSFNLYFIRYATSMSMLNSIQKNDKVFVNVFDHNYNRGDIVMYKAKTNSNKNYDNIKRIIALPNEKVDINIDIDGTTRIYINGKLLHEKYIDDKISYPKPPDKYLHYTVPNDSYYVLGDNRGNSLDSRYLGAIPKSVIKGRVTHIYSPYSRRQSFKTPQY